MQQNKRTHKRNTFTPEEDACLRYLVAMYGESSWAIVTSFMPNRNVRQCRERWFNYLSPAVNNKEWSEAEDKFLLQKVDELGSKWKDISRFFNGRTDINIKSRYRVLMRKTESMKSFINNKPFQLPQEQEKPKNSKPTPEIIVDNVFFDLSFDQYEDIF